MQNPVKQISKEGWEKMTGLAVSLPVGEFSEALPAHLPVSGWFEVYVPCDQRHSGRGYFGPLLFLDGA